MKKSLFIAAITLFGMAEVSLGQCVNLHVNTKWEECSFQLDSTLTQGAWEQFTKEAGLVTYFRSLTDAKPMGAGHFEVALLQWQTGIDDSDAAWNDTFVHPDSSHWLFEGSRLPFPGLTARVGITKKIDAAVYFTKNPKANYGLWGGQLQYNLVNNLEQKWAATARMSFVALYGPDDLNLNVIGFDGLVSKEIKVYSNWVSISPYVGASLYLSNAHEKSEKVNLDDEHKAGLQGMVGAVARLSVVRLGVEYNFANVSTLSLKVGVAF
jgi:hypothetical protein